MKNFAHTNFGSFDSLNQFVFKKGNLQSAGKLFLAEHLSASGSEISINRMEPGQSMGFLHRHQKNEEIYLCVEGKGDILVDGRRIPLTQGSVVRIAPEGVRSIRAAEDEALVYFCVQSPINGLDDFTVSDGVGVEGQENWESAEIIPDSKLH